MHVRLKLPLVLELALCVLGANELVSDYVVQCGARLFSDQGFHAHSQQTAFPLYQTSFMTTFFAPSAS
jgi:hypothetical protein